MAVVRRPGCSWWPPRPPARRRPTGLPCWGQRALQRGDAASGQGRRRGQGRNCRRQRAAVQLGGQLCGDSVVQGLDGRCVVARGCRVHRQVRYLRIRREGDVRAVSHLSVVQDLRDIAGNRSFKHVYICSCCLSPVAIPQSAGSAARSWSGIQHPLTGATACWCVNRTNPSSAQVSASTCHSPWVSLKARPAPGPHQARTRPAPGPHQARTRVFSEVAWLQCDSLDLTEKTGQK